MNGRHDTSACILNLDISRQGSARGRRPAYLTCGLEP